jgi:uncharacterized protein YqjF (DUF2071 family)
VYFFSLDAANGLAVEIARGWFKLPYFRAEMELAHEGDWLRYESRRTDSRGREARLHARYRPAGEVFHAEPGSLEWFLAERYCLYTTDARNLLHRAEIHHAPWPLQPADAEIELTTLAPLELDGTPICHFSRRLDVVVWPLEQVR